MIRQFLRLTQFDSEQKSICTTMWFIILSQIVSILRFLHYSWFFWSQAWIQKCSIKTKFIYIKCAVHPMKQSVAIDLIWAFHLSTTSGLCYFFKASAQYVKGNIDILKKILLTYIQMNWHAYCDQLSYANLPIKVH